MGKFLDMLGLKQPTHWQPPPQAQARQFFTTPQPSVAQVDAQGAAAAALPPKTDPAVQWPAEPVVLDASHLGALAAALRARIVRQGNGTIDFMSSPDAIAAFGDHVVHVCVQETPTHLGAPWRKLRLSITALDPQLRVGTVDPIEQGTAAAAIDATVRAVVSRIGSGTVVFEPEPATLNVHGAHTLQVRVRADDRHAAAGPLPLKVEILKRDPRLHVAAVVTLKVGEDVEKAVRAAIRHEGDGVPVFSQPFAALARAGRYPLEVHVDEGTLHRRSAPHKLEVVVERLPSAPVLKEARFEEVFEPRNAKKPGFLRETLQRLVDRKGADGAIVMDPAEPAYTFGEHEVRIWLDDGERYAKSAPPLSVAVRIRMADMEAADAYDAWSKRNERVLTKTQRELLKTAKLGTRFDFMQTTRKNGFVSAAQVEALLNTTVGAMSLPVITRVILWEMMGYTFANANEWTMVESTTVDEKIDGQMKTKTIHLSVSANAIKLPARLDKTGAELYQDMFLIPNQRKRVHATLEGPEPKPHRYLEGPFDDANTRATAADKAAMNTLLAAFKTRVTARLGASAALLAGYRLPDGS